MKLLDLYCCGGGAGHGYEKAGYDVTGIDIEPQPKHRGKIIIADAIEYLKAHFKEYDVIHASPPCQKYSMSSMQFRKAGKEYVDLILPNLVDIHKDDVFANALCLHIEKLLFLRFPDFLHVHIRFY